MLEQVTGDAELTTAPGEVRAGEIDGRAVIKNSNGDTRIGDVGGDLRVKAANGDIAIEHAHDSVVTKTANGDIRVGNVHRGSVVAETGIGAIEVGIADGSAAWLDLNTHFGHVHNDLDAAGTPGSRRRAESRCAPGLDGDITIHRSYPIAATAPSPENRTETDMNDNQQSRSGASASGSATLSRWTGST